jgi:antibiotic biosynthesis monooxygenase (ABM) superfamily enzyme
MENQGATVVISHQIKEEKQKEYEEWLEEIGPICRSFKGNIDW